tara:strand:- start:119 stop:763 length:645 start_codon:yes stop_codon:yes gene_type:complete
MADAAKQRRGSRKTNKPINLEEIAKRRQWAGKEAAKEKEEDFRSALQLPFWRRGEKPKAGDYLLAYYPYKTKKNSGFFIGIIKALPKKEGEMMFDIFFLYTGAVVRTPYHWLKPIYTWMMTVGKNKNCLSLEGYDLEKSCVVRFLAKAIKSRYKKNYNGKEPKKRKREVQKQKMPAPATFKQETGSDSETDDEPEPNEEELPEESVREFQKLLF